MHSRFFITFSPPRATLYLAGEFDVTERAELHRRIDDAIVLGCIRLEVDGAAVTFIDASCLRELSAGKARLARLGRSFVVRRTSPVFDRAARRLSVSPLGGTPPAPHRSPGAPQKPVASPRGRADGA
jgi:anti-anti-sigma regulatory factor